MRILISVIFNRDNTFQKFRGEVFNSNGDVTAVLFAKSTDELLDKIDSKCCELPIYVKHPCYSELVGIQYDYVIHHQSYFVLPQQESISELVNKLYNL